MAAAGTQGADENARLFYIEVTSSLVMRVERAGRKKQQCPKVTFYNYLHN